MRKFGIAVVVLVGVAAAVAILALSPAVFGQTARRGETPRGTVFPSLMGGSEIGVSIREVGRDDVAKMKLPAEAGAVIEDVRGGGPADTAGVREGDVFVEFDGERVRTAAQLTRVIRETPAGRRVKAAVIRDGRRTDLELVPAEGPGLRLPFDGDEVRQSIERILPLEMRRAVLGVTIQEMTPELAGYFGAKDGVLVTSVTEGSAAEKAGLKVGDVIIEVAGRSVNDSRDFVREIQGHEGEIALKIVRDKKEQTIKVTPEARATQERRDRRILRGI